MKRTLCMAVALSCWSLGSPAADEAREEYEVTVGQLYGFMSALPHTFEWCREKYPDISQSLAEALNIVRKKVATEIRASLDGSESEKMRMSWLVLPGEAETDPRLRCDANQRLVARTSGASHLPEID